MTTLSALSPDLLTNEEAAALLGIKPNTLEIWRTKGKGPEFVKLGRTKSAPIRYWRQRCAACSGARQAIDGREFSGLS